MSDGASAAGLGILAPRSEVSVCSCGGCLICDLSLMVGNVLCALSMVSFYTEFCPPGEGGGQSIALLHKIGKASGHRSLDSRVLTFSRTSSQALHLLQVVGLFSPLPGCGFSVPLEVNSLNTSAGAMSSIIPSPAASVYLQGHSWPGDLQEKHEPSLWLHLLGGHQSRTGAE